MKKLLSWAIAIAMVISMMPANVFATTEDEADAGYNSNELIVVYKDSADCTRLLEDEGFQIDQAPSEEIINMADSCVETVAEEAGVQVESGEFISSGLGNDGAVLTVSLAEGSNVDDMIAAIEADPEVAYVQPNYRYELLGLGNELESMITYTDDTYLLPDPNDSTRPYQYSLGAWDPQFKADCGANVFEAWSMAKSNGVATVAVIDSGVDMDHPDLVDNINWRYAADATYVPVRNKKIKDEIGHGTHVAGIIGATANNGVGVAGSSYNASILPIKVVDSDGSIYTTTLIRAFEYVASLVSSGKVDNLHVINLSIGGYNYEAGLDEALYDEISKLRNDYNVLTVCAAGNKGTTKPVFPGDFNVCFCVTALNNRGQDTYYSDYNEYKDISAPGGDDEVIVNSKGEEVVIRQYEIISTLPNNSYGLMRGTSMAAPLVSGIMALLWAEDPELKVSQAVKAAQATAHPVNPIGARGEKSGSAGAIDAAAALEYVQNNYLASSTNIASGSINIESGSYTYTGTAHKPNVTKVVVGGKTLVKDTDYKVYYANNVNAGKGTVYVKGIGKYSGTLAKQFTIDKVPITSISLDKTGFTYDGNKKSPAITVKAVVNGTSKTVGSKLTKDTAFVDISWTTGRTEVGSYKARAKGLGNYYGTLEKSYTIKPPKSYIKSLTSANNGFTVKWAKKTTQTTGYQLQYSTSSKFPDNSKTKSITFTSNTRTDKKVTKLKDKKYYYVRIRTYKKIDGKKCYSYWSSKKKIKTK